MPTGYEAVRPQSAPGQDAVRRRCNPPAAA